MELRLKTNHELVGNGYFVGLCNENQSEQLIISIDCESLLNKYPYLEFELMNGSKYSTERLTIVNGKITYNIPNGLLPEGYVKVQVVFRDATNFVWKSFVRKFNVGASLCVSDSLPVEHPDFITEAQHILDECEDAVEEIEDFKDEIEERVDQCEEDVEECETIVASYEAAEASRVSAETTRQSNEVTRQSNETSRVSAESSRVSAESSRVTAETNRASAETSRVSAETSRSNAETSRASAEETRASNETTRQSNETTRQTNESNRSSAETSRVSAETSRANAEATRVSNETTRGNNETSRTTAETNRATAETGRVSAEELRVSAETTRQSNEETRQSQEATRQTGYAQFNGRITSLEVENDIQESRITNIEHALSGTIIAEQTIDNVGTQTLPANVLPYGELNKLGGLTKKWNQIINKDNFPATTTISGITYTNNNDGKIITNGTATSASYINIRPADSLITGHKYLLVGCPSGGGSTTYTLYAYTSGSDTNKYDNGSGVIFTTLADTTYSIRFLVRANYTADNLIITPQFIDLTNIYGTGNEPASVSAFLSDYPIFNSYVAYTTGSLSYNKPSSVVIKNSSQEVVSTLLETQLTAINNKLTNLGYDLGYGLDKDHCNYIDFASKKAIIGYSRVDLGTLNYTYITTYDYPLFRTSITGALAYGSTAKTSICDKYEAITNKSYNYYREHNYNGKCCFLNNQGNPYFAIQDTNYTDAATFKSAMSGIYLVYELATPIEVDISDILTDSDSILPNLEATGTITPVNTNNYPLPIKLIIQKKVTE